MDSKGIQIPFSIIIFLIILLVIVALLLIWNFSGFESFSHIFSSAGSAVKNQSGGVVDSLI